jgi:hypothetical protein
VTFEPLKVFKAEYAQPKQPTVIDVGPGTYLTIDGEGEPGGGTFDANMGALFSVGYTIKFALKKAGRDFKLGAVEGLWWTAGGGKDWQDVPRGEWRWKLLLRVPDFVSEQDLAGALADLHARRKPGPIDGVRLETLHEGPAIQILHLGPYADETRTLAQMEAFAEAQGLTFHGPHHEIYLSDPRRVAPERMKTILRHPVRAKEG